MILYIANEKEFQEINDKETFTSSTLTSEGFIHCSKPNQVIDVVNKHFKGEKSLSILCIDEDMVTSKIKYENKHGNTELYPHIYGELNLNSVKKVIKLECSKNNEFKENEEIKSLIKDQVVQETCDYVKSKLEGEGSGHDWWHVYRVWKSAISITKHEKADLFTVELAALLHDIADWKFCNGDETVGPTIAGEWLEKEKVDSKVINHVKNIIENLSFKGAGVKSKINTIEGMIVQDADRLDAIGAIGIARTFAYGGYKGREIYNPGIKPQLHQTFEEYKKSDGHTINHFYEKLFLLKDLMNTNTAKMIAEQRHEFMVEFLDKFYGEWEGNDLK